MMADDQIDDEDDFIPFLGTFDGSSRPPRTPEQQKLFCDRVRAQVARLKARKAAATAGAVPDKPDTEDWAQP